MEGMKRIRRPTQRWDPASEGQTRGSVGELRNAHQRWDQREVRHPARIAGLFVFVPQHSLSQNNGTMLRRHRGGEMHSGHLETRWPDDEDHKWQHKLGWPHGGARDSRRGLQKVSLPSEPAFTSISAAIVCLREDELGESGLAQPPKPF